MRTTSGNRVVVEAERRGLPHALRVRRRRPADRGHRVRQPLRAGRRGRRADQGSGPSRTTQATYDGNGNQVDRDQRARHRHALRVRRRRQPHRDHRGRRHARGSAAPRPATTTPTASRRRRTPAASSRTSSATAPATRPPCSRPSAPPRSASRATSTTATTASNEETDALLDRDGARLRRRRQPARRPRAASAGPTRARCASSTTRTTARPRRSTARASAPNTSTTALGNRTRLTVAPGTPEQRVNIYRYDLDNRLIAEVDGNGVETQYRYDGAGNRLEIDPARRRVRRGRQPGQHLPGRPDRRAGPPHHVHLRPRQPHHAGDRPAGRRHVLRGRRARQPDGDHRRQRRHHREHLRRARAAGEQPGARRRARRRARHQRLRRVRQRHSYAARLRRRLRHAPDRIRLRPAGPPDHDHRVRPRRAAERRDGVQRGIHHGDRLRRVRQPDRAHVRRLSARGGRPRLRRREGRARASAGRDLRLRQARPARKHDRRRRQHDRLRERHPRQPHQPDHGLRHGRCAQRALLLRPGRPAGAPRDAGRRHRHARRTTRPATRR